MLSFKKLSPVFFALTVLTSLAPVAHSGPEAAPTDKVSVVRGKSTPVGLREMGRFVQGFLVEADGSCADRKLRIRGLIHPACLKHLRVSLDNPETDSTGVWAIRVEKANLVDPSSSDLVIHDVEENCKEEITSQCTRPEPGVPPSKDDCVEVSQIEGFVNAFGKALHSGGEVKYRMNNRNDFKSPYSLEEFPEKMSNLPVVGSDNRARIESCREERVRVKAERDKATLDRLLSTCKDAAKGDSEAKDEFKRSIEEAFGETGVAEYKDVIEDLERAVFEAAVKEISKKVQTAVDFDALNDLIDEIDRFGRDTDHANAVKTAVNLLGEVMLASNSLQVGSDDELNARLKLVERAAKTARALDPRNESLKTALYAAKLERCRASAESGNDRFYNAQTRRECYQAGSEIQRWATRPNSSDSVRSLARSYFDALSYYTPNSSGQYVPRMIPLGPQNPMTGLATAHVPGTALDEIFAKRRLANQTQDQMRGQPQMNPMAPMAPGSTPQPNGTLSLDAQFNAYKANLLYGNSGGGF